MIKGQEELFTKIDSFTNETLPHSILLIGEVGSGKDDVCRYIADKFDLDLFDLTESISNEFIDQINQMQTRSLYVVDIQKITIKDQNVMLKLYEEPSLSTYLILKSTTDYGPIDTILSRSYILKMKNFSKDLLESLIESDNKDYVLKICSTPGQIELANHTDIEKLKQLCDTMATKIETAPFFNVMSIADKINFSDNYDKFDLLLFIKALSQSCLEFNNYKVYKNLKQLDKFIWNMNNKKAYFEHFLIESWNKH